MLAAMEAPSSPAAPAVGDEVVSEWSFALEGLCTAPSVEFRQQARELESRLGCAEQALRSGSAKLEQAAADLGRRIAGAEASLAGLEAQAARAVGMLREKASAADLDQVRRLLEDRLPGVEQTRAKAEGDQVRYLAGALADVQRQIAALEGAVQRKADAAQLQAASLKLGQAAEAIAGLQEDLKTGSDKVRSLDGLAAGVGQRIARVEQALQGKADAQQLQELESVAAATAQAGQLAQVSQERTGATQVQQLRNEVARCDARLASAEQALRDRPWASQFQHLKASLGCAEAKLASLEQGLGEKVGSAPVELLRSALSSVQARTCETEQHLQDKASLEHLQQVKGAVGGVQARLGTVEQAVQDRATLAQLQQSLIKSFGPVEARLAGFEQEVKGKAGSGQLRLLQEELASLQARFSRMEHSVLDGVECMRSMEDSLQSVKAQAVRDEHVLRDSVEQLGKTPVGVETKQDMSTIRATVGSVEMAAAGQATAAAPMRVGPGLRGRKRPPPCAESALLMLGDEVFFSPE